MCKYDCNRLFLDRNTEHNISYSIINNNFMGAISYACAGEVNPHISVAWNTITNNCRHIPASNISTCDMPIQFQLQNTQSLLLHVKIYLIFLSVRLKS